MNALGKLLARGQSCWIGDAVAAAVGATAPVYRMGICKLPRSGKKDELLDHYGISRRAIEEKVLALAA